MKPILTAVIILLILSGCRNKETDENVSIAKAKLPPPTDLKKVDIALDRPESAPVQPITDTSKKIIKSGDISFETNDLRGTRKKILTALKKLNGYVAEENETNNEGYRRELILKLRVPARNFDLLLDSVSADAGKIDSKNINVKDVTTQYLDIKTQLSNKRLLEETYRGLLKKADKIGDVLQIENKITDIRTEIDSTQGELNYLSKQAAYSSLSITFYTRQIQQITGNGLWFKFKTAITDGWRLLQDLFFGLITIWPIVILLTVLWVITKRWLIRRKLKPAQL